MEIGLQPARLGLIDEAQFVLRPSFHDVADIGAKRQRLPVAFSRHVHLDRHERRILDADADLFHRRDEIGPAVFVLAQDRGKQLHQRHAADRRAEVEPGPIAANFHVEVAAEWRIPALHRRRTLAGARGARNQRLKAGGVLRAGQAFAGG